MLPLITNMLPQPAASQPSALAATQGGTVMVGGEQAGARPQMAAAVTALPSASAYSAQLPQRVAEMPVRPMSAQPERAAILPDPDFWKVPTREAAPQPAARQTPQVNLPQMAQFSAQMLAQQAAAALPRAEAESDAPPLRRQESSLPAKKPGLGDARGAAAYQVASGRNRAEAMPASTELVM